MRRATFAVVPVLFLIASYSMAAAEPANKVLVLPFAPANPADSQLWAGHSLQQSLAADISATGSAQVQSGTTVASDMDAALAAGIAAGAKYVVFGSFASSGSELRVTGQIVDVTRHESVGALKVTGPVQDLFKLEDVIGAQARQTLAFTASGTTPRISVAASNPDRQALVNRPMRPGEIIIIPSGRPHEPAGSASAPATTEAAPEAPDQGGSSSFGPTVYYPPGYLPYAYYFPGYVEGTDSGSQVYYPTGLAPLCPPVGCLPYDSCYVGAGAFPGFYFDGSFDRRAYGRGRSFATSFIGPGISAGTHQRSGDSAARSSWRGDTSAATSASGGPRTWTAAGGGAHSSSHASGGSTHSTRGR
jgi:TolB-like protein